jgi:hypothetical protein
MLLAKVHLLIIVILTQLAVLYTGKCPYYPIEISRTIASDPLPGSVFRAGIISMLGTMWLTNALTKQTFALWISLLVIAFFDDDKYWLLHMIGVAMMGCVCSYSILLRGSPAFLTMAAGGLIFAFRIVMAAIAVMTFEMKKSERFVSWKQYWFNVAVVYNRAMFEGPRSPDSHMMFQMKGVLQWVVFWMLASLF